MQLNAEDGGHRQCIMVTNNENNICEEVTYERNKRVINGYTKPNGDKVEGLKDNTLRYYTIDWVENSTTLSNKRKLMSLATDMLCIKEDIYQEKDVLGGQQLVNPQIARFFSENGREMLVIYEDRAVDAVVEVLKTCKVHQPIKVYVFSNTQYPHTDNFAAVLGKVDLCALPSAIFNAYKQFIKI